MKKDTTLLSKVHKSYKRLFFILFSVGGIWTVNAQSIQPKHYFDFWESGVWNTTLTIYNRDTIPEKDEFKVTAIGPNGSFEERWKIYIGEGEYVKAHVLRAYDDSSKKWKLFYVDDTYAQSWDSEMHGDTLYFLKKFQFKDKVFTSRQSWRKDSKGRIVRTIDRSENGGEYKLRYYQILSKE